ncbi:hypothetical protein ACFX1Q_040899 [Malus domestica]
MSLVNDTRIMLLRSLLICKKKKLQRRRNKRKRSAPFCKLKQKLSAAQLSKGYGKLKGGSRFSASTSGVGSATENKSADKAQNGPPPGPVVSSSLNPKISVKGAPLSIAVGKRKRDEKPMAISVEEAAALKAGEDARKRERERERETNAWPLPAATVWLL